MNVTLIRFTPDAEALCGYAAAKCYNGSNPERSLAHAVGGGHLSVTEHATFTFEVDGVSRVLLAQLTRHRLASFSVASQGYISLDNKFEYVVPKAIRDLGQAQVKEFEREMAQMHKWYCQWQVKLGGMEWTARCSDNNTIPEGTLVQVDIVEGVKVFVSPVEIPAGVSR